MTRFRPTRRDALVAFFGAACTLALLYLDPSVASSGQHFISVPHTNPLFSTNSNVAADAHNHKGSNAGLPPVQAIAKGRKAHANVDRKPNKPREIMPSTKIIAHAPGWTIFDNLYMFNGTLLIISNEDQSELPEKRLMTSTGLPAKEGNEAEREPTDRDMDYLPREIAAARFSDRIMTIPEMSVLVNDPPQFIDHYYHYAAEFLLGFWRMYSGLDPKITSKGETTLPDPSRIIFAHCTDKEWRDYTSFNPYFTFAAFPNVAIETSLDWAARASITDGIIASDDDASVNTAKAYRLERVLLVDRSAAFRMEIVGAKTQRTASTPFYYNKDWASKWWWEPIRRRLLTFARVDEKVINYALLGSDAKGSGSELQTQPQPPVVITYVSRQGWRRRLIEEHHTLLMESVTALCKSKGWEFILFHPERFTRDEQLAIAAKTTIMFGVHGNGLTHLLAMAPTPISAVIEIFYPGGYARDYQWTSEALGMKHFGVHNDTWFTSPNTPPYAVYPEGFQGTQIPVYGPTVAKLIADRVEGRLPDPPLP